MVARWAATAYQRGMTGNQLDAAKAAEDLVHRMRAGERNAMARVATELERLSPTVPALLAAMQPYLGGALVVGITGPPGSGKSTLLNALIAHIRGAGRSIGVIAVDPSSPVSGGAILGDRIRMTSALDDDGVFVRSLASRGYLGGLSPAAVRMLDAFDAAGKEIILVETVGTGQSEIDIVDVTDVRVIVAAPGLGDDIQAMKAGLLEIADILVVNKADLDGADRTLHQLRSALSMRAHGRDAVPVLKASAVNAEGMPDLWSAIEACGARRLAESIESRRRHRARYLIARAAADLVAQRIRDGAGDTLDAFADDVLAGRLLPADAAKTILEKG
jgi:LAO/AO transport system kinase